MNKEYIKDPTFKRSKPPTFKRIKPPTFKRSKDPTLKSKDVKLTGTDSLPFIPTDPSKIRYPFNGKIRGRKL